MPTPQSVAPQPLPKYVGGNGNYTVPLVILTSLFFMWGFITVLNDVLIPHLKGIFELSYFQAMAIQLCFFGAYGVVSYPAGVLVRNVGYKKGVVIGLIIAGIGCLMFYPAGSLRVYAIFLAALFVLASGITILQVAANPYVTRLGNPDSAPQRLTLTQAFNSLGTTVGPIFGSILILSAACGADLSALSPAELDAMRQREAEAVQVPYLMIAGMLFVLAAVFAVLKNLPVIVDAEAEPGQAGKSAWQYPHLVLGAIAIFVYVGGEVSIGSLIVNFLGEPHIAGMEDCEAGEYVSYYWGAAMIGRFIGVALMAFIRPGRFLAINACIVCVLLVLTSLTSGNVAMWSVLAIGLFNATMFPVIFSLAVHRLGPATSQGSGILCVAIVGGAIIPPLQGLLADNIGLQLSFLMPIACYLYIVFYGLKGHRVQH